MAITKILARKGRLDVGIHYVLNGDKTQEQILTAHLNCEPGRELRQMLETKSQYDKEDGVQYYHMIQSFRPGEVSPELALEIAQTLVEEHLPGYQAVIGVHVDKEHIHAHIIFNSVNADTGEKYHSSPQSYYRQIRAISDRLCREHGLSVILEGQGARAVSYAERLRQSSGQPTFRAMLEADLRDAIQDANDLGFRLRGQDRFMMPGRKKSLFTEEGIRAAIQGELSAIEQGLRPAIIPRPAYRPFRPHPKYKGFLALYVHYLYLLGKARQRQYPPRMTPQLRQAAAQAERYRQRFYFLRDNDIATPEDMAAFLTRTEDALASLTKQRTIFNVRKKKRQVLYTALADVEALAIAKQLYEDGVSGMEEQFARYLDAVARLEGCGCSREQLLREKAEVYQRLAEVNRQIRQERQKLAICREIQKEVPQMERSIQYTMEPEEVRHDERRRR